MNDDGHPKGPAPAGRPKRAAGAKPAPAAPTPVRDSLRDRRREGSREDVATRHLEIGGESWEIRAVGAGKTRSGGAPLLELELVGPDRIERRLVVGQGLESVTDDDLAEMIQDLSAG